MFRNPCAGTGAFRAFASAFAFVLLAVAVSALLALPALASTGASAHGPALGASLGAGVVGLSAYNFLRSFRGDSQTIAFVAPAGGLLGGTWHFVGEQIVLVMQDTAAGDTAVGIVETTDAGIEYPKAAVTTTNGTAVYWDANGNPVGGVAGSGAVTNTDDTGANTLLGYAVETNGAGDVTARFRKVRL